MHAAQLRIMVALATAASLAIAGPNEKAEFFIDLSVSSTAFDSSAAVPVDSTFTAGVAISQASKLYDYELFVVYDTARLQFVSALKGNEQSPNFLESNGGSIFFQGKKSRDDSTRVLIGATLTGDEPSECVDGGGFLSLLTFKKLTADTTMLSLSKILVEDCEERADTACVAHEAMILTGTIGILTMQRPRARLRDAVRVSNGMVRLLMPPGARDIRATISDISGREIRRFACGSNGAVADMRSASPGVYVISVVHGNKTSSYPLLVKR